MQTYPRDFVTSLQIHKTSHDKIFPIPKKMQFMLVWLERVSSSQDKMLVDDVNITIVNNF